MVSCVRRFDPMISSNARRPPPIFGREPLADHPAQRVGEPDANLLLFFRLEHTQNTVDGLARVDRVQRAQDQMAGFRRAQGDLHRLAVAHFADENHLRRLAQRGAQAVGITVKINAQFALVERGFVVRMHDIPPGLPA